jgi:hypothetical protein
VWLIVLLNTSKSATCMIRYGWQTDFTQNLQQALRGLQCITPQGAVM